MYDILIPVKAIDRINKNGFLLMWTNSNYGDKIVYEKIVSWQVYTKKQAIDIIKMICIMAYVDSLDFEYTVYNTKVSQWHERDNAQVILYTEDQTLLEYNDQDVRDLVEMGFINLAKLHESMLSYYYHLNS